MATTASALICPQGHGPGGPGSRFCTYCGTPLVAESAPGAGVSGAGTAAGLGAPNGQWQPVGAAAAVPSAGQWQPTSGTAVPAAAPAAMPVAAAVAAPPVAQCNVCGGDGSRLSAAEDVCPQCAWLRPLLPGYQLDKKIFLWAQDGQAMSKLQSLPALGSVVRSVSDKVGRPWIESTFNAIRLGPRQLPDVWRQAVLAARILGLPKLPDVYISGDQMWNTYTYGTETSSFIVLGTSHVINFANDELLFVLAREMGHCRAGHALWKTVTRFIAGDTSVHSGLLSDGLINAISPTKLIHGALDLPLMAWARQSEITADRAGLLAVGDEALARRVLLAWSVRSARLLQQVNIEEWMKQEEASDDQMTRLSEMTTSSSMYATRRLRLLGQSAHESELMRWSASIQPVRRKLAPQPTQMLGLGVGTVRTARPPGAGPQAAGGAVRGPATATAGGGPGEPPADSIRVACPKCHAGMRIPLAVLRGKPALSVRCPQCKNVFTLRAKTAPPAAPADAQTKPVAQPATTTAALKPTAPTSAQAKPVAPAAAPNVAQAKPVAAPAAPPQAKSHAQPPAAAKTTAPTRAAQKHAGSPEKRG
jgi:predicted Zn finger-like uncharacterized protein